MTQGAVIGDLRDYNTVLAKKTELSIKIQRTEQH